MATTFLYEIIEVLGYFLIANMMLK